MHHCQIYSLLFWIHWGGIWRWVNGLEEMGGGRRSVFPGRWSWGFRKARLSLLQPTPHPVALRYGGLERSGRNFEELLLWVRYWILFSILPEPGKMMLISYFWTILPWMWHSPKMRLQGKPVFILLSLFSSKEKSLTPIERESFFMAVVLSLRMS